jgi:hypothetical protein
MLQDGPKCLGSSLDQTRIRRDQSLKKRNNNIILQQSINILLAAWSDVNTVSQTANNNREFSSERGIRSVLFQGLQKPI